MAIGVPENLRDSHGLDTLSKLIAEDTIAVPQQVSGDPIKWKGFPQLLDRPVGSRMRGHVEMDDAAAVVSQDEEYIQDLEANGGHGEEVNRHRLRKFMYSRI